MDKFPHEITNQIEAEEERLKLHDAGAEFMLESIMSYLEQ